MFRKVPPVVLVFRTKIDVLGQNVSTHVVHSTNLIISSISVCECINGNYAATLGTFNLIKMRAQTMRNVYASCADRPPMRSRVLAYGQNASFELFITKQQRHHLLISKSVYSKTYLYVKAFILSGIMIVT